ncbi:MAG: hypothetical protein CME65_08725 [Halobacteriovoraceae bacterium]|nr:hypothetical protein [Halobacteriovoraceae bacterium]|tara:strand:+ start:5041 stop:7236 length:2196 start_codon:yes stop_codon:yes gene_type:complete
MRLTLLIFFFSSCSLILTTPDELSFEQRIKVLNEIKKPKLNAPVNIYWHHKSIPFIEAQDDDDLAFSLGLVHAHLRIDQLEVLRRIAYGRLSEVAGPIPQVEDIDHALRIINFPKGARNSLKVMQPESLSWMKNFTAGLNWYIEHAQMKPITSKLIDKKVEKYTIEEVMSIGRIVGADLSWITYAKYLREAKSPQWENKFNKSKEKLKIDTPSIRNNLISFFELLENNSKSGSNSVAISADKTNTNSSMIASDPHVGLTLPNFWLMVGIKSPHFHAMGYMIPGVPIIGVGRNNNIAWGGTNMRAISSHLYDVTDLPSEKITSREEILKRRWWFDKKIQIRETPFGPIFSDVDFFDPESLGFKAALNWQGHQGSDEIYTFLKIAQAKNWKEFKEAFRTYRVSAMNITYADKAGHIGMVAAYGQPVLKNPEKTLDFLKKMDNPVLGVNTPLTLPRSFDPKDGFIASANNKPFDQTDVPFAFSFSNNHRVERLQELIREKEILTINDLKNIQLDVFSRPSFELRNTVLEKVGPDFLKEIWFEKFSTWDGKFLDKSQGALAFHGVMYFLAQEKYLEDSNWKENLLKELRATKGEKIKNKLIKHSPEIKKFMRKFKSWGDFTRQSQKTIFGMIPLIGERYSYDSIPLSGNSDTINKYGRSLNLEVSEVSYGASARHISDLSSPDENYFIQNGGQDSWLMNENLADQAAMFKRGEYLKLPLTMDKVKKSFNRSVTSF